MTETWVCTLCDSPFITVQKPREGLRPGRRVPPEPVTMPVRCSNDECQFADRRRVTFGSFKRKEG